MIVASSAIRRSMSLAAAFCLAIWSIAGVSRHARGAEDAAASLPPAVENLWRWFPENTETMVVAQSFKIPRPQNDKNADFAGSIWDHLQDFSLGDLAKLEGDAGLDELIDREVSVAINGARNFTIVSAFGSLRCEGCGIVRFKEPLPDDGRRLIDALRKKAKGVRTIAGTEVFVFPDRTVTETTIKPKKWQGQYITCLSADTLLCASSDAFLREVLQRSAERPAGRALAADLPAWKHVDCTAPVWMIRHIPRKFAGQLAAGVTWSLKPQGRNVFEIAYIPVEGKDPLPVAEIWKDRHLDAQPTIAAKEDCTVVVTIDLEKGKQQLWYGFTIYWSLGEVGQPQSSMSHTDLLRLADGDDPEEDVENPPNAEDGRTQWQR